MRSDVGKLQGGRGGSRAKLRGGKRAQLSKDDMHQGGRQRGPGDAFGVIESLFRPVRSLMSGQKTYVINFLARKSTPRP